MNIQFNGKRAIVTGAGKGIGRGIALRLTELGAKVFALSRTESDLVSLKSEAPSIETRCVDISQWENTKQIIEAIGPVDLLVNNAGVAGEGKILDNTVEDIDKHFETNYKAVLNISQTVAKGMISQNRGGSIVNISSIYGILAAPLYSNYCASKAAVDMLTKVMACELAPYKIRVNSVNPTGVMTPMSEKVMDTEEKVKDFVSRIPLQRWAEISEVVDPVMFLLSDYASMITGVILPVDGGHTCHIANTCS